jgi:ribose/xylose/arabinose/galactoside ABC-type transport system permease subunit
MSAVTRDLPRTAAGQAIRHIPVSLLVVVGLIVLLLVIGTIASPRFASLNNFLNVFQQSAALGFVSLGQTIVVLIGGIDLSVGATISLTSNFASGWIDGDPNMVVPVVVGVIALGAAIGCVNGALSHYLRVHPLIVTLGMAAILQGCTLLYSLAPVGKVTDDFETFAYGRIFGCPTAASRCWRCSRWWGSSCIGRGRAMRSMSWAATRAVRGSSACRSPAP